MVAFKAPLAAKDVPSLKRRLERALEAYRHGLRATAARLPWSLAVATDVAQPAARAACEREKLGLIDQAGTLIVQEGPIYFHIEGTGKVKRQLRATPFAGKGARIVRLLLESPGTALTAREVAHLTRTSFAYTYGVLTRLEDDGYLSRRSPRTGFRLVRPVELLEAWLQFDARPLAIVEPYYAPSTEPADLERVAKRLSGEGIAFAFTLQSALTPEQQYVSGLPHGLYLNGDSGLVVEELKLRKVTPHNFLILRPAPVDSTIDYGVFRKNEQRVATPQLMLDLVTHGGGRGREQADALLAEWARQAALQLASTDD